jgi:jumonji domain-containing protein 2
MFVLRTYFLYHWMFRFYHCHVFRFERMAEGLFPNLVKDCPAYLRHKMCLISPTILRQNSIPYNKVFFPQIKLIIC